MLAGAWRSPQQCACSVRSWCVCVACAADNEGRYSYDNQPAMCRWNCGKLGEVLEPLFGGADWRGELVRHFDQVFAEAHTQRMVAKVRRRIMRGAGAAACA